MKPPRGSCCRALRLVAAFAVLPPLSASLRAEGGGVHFDRAAAAHLLSRAGFGGTPEEVDALVALGLEKAVEGVLSPPAPDPAGDFTPTLKDRPEGRDLAGLSKEERQKRVQEHRRKDQDQFQALRAWWLRRMVLARHPLEEKMTLFWHGHFATSQRDVRNSYHMYLQNRTLRAYALGSFRDLVRAIAQDPAMLEYLDNNRNQKSHPNENFARELMELFTLGAGNYTEQDVKEAARALTGWTFRGNEFAFARRAHDTGEKTFLGRKGEFTGDDVIDIIFEQPAASRFLVKKLFVYFVHEDPPAEMIETLAATLRESKFEMRPVLARIFRSREFYSGQARGSRIKGPVELVAGTLRLLDVDPGASPAFTSLAGRMGQDLLLPPSVKGWDGGQSWISTSTLFDRYNFARPVLGLEDSRPSGANGGPGKKAGKKAVRDAFRSLPRWNADAGRKLVLGKDPEKLSAAEAVDRVVRRFLLVPLAPEARKKLEDFYSGADPETRLEELIHLVLSSPEYQVG